MFLRGEHMAFFEWKDEYNVGITRIDEQHKTLVSFLNDLFEAMKTGKGNEKLDAVLKGLVEYTKTHFATEENLMKVYRFPGYEEHKTKHEEMTGQVLRMYRRFNAENKLNTLEIATYLKDWLKHHIMGTDKLYRTFLLEKGVR